MDHPIIDFKIWMTRRIDIPGLPWHVHVVDQKGIWQFDGMDPEFKVATGFIEMGMEAVNNSAKNAKKECEDKGHDFVKYGNTNLNSCSRCGELK